MKTKPTEWSDPLVGRLIRKHRGQDPFDVIESFARARREEFGQTALPVDVHLIASCLGIRRRFSDDLPFAGRIYAEASGQLVMDLNAMDSTARQNFTCAHEIIHTAFPGFKRETRYRTDTTVGRHLRRRDEEEFLCDYGAAELLMPRDLVEGEYRVERGLRDIERLHRDADVSLEAAAHRVISLSDAPSMLLVFRMRHKPADLPAIRRGEEVPEKLRLQYCISNGVRTYVPKYKAAEEGSVYCDAVSTPRAVKRADVLPADRGEGVPYLVEAKNYPFQGRDRVLAVARPA